MIRNLIKNANISESAVQIRKIVDEAIKNGYITHDDYNKIIEVSGKDGHIDIHEQAVLSELHIMLHDKDIKFK